jgi:probable phosphoglycerate mutase
VAEKTQRTRFGLLRHAETLWNREKRIQGVSDSPLTREGYRQAEKWGKILSTIAWDRILVSDIGRALETATRINRVLKISIGVERRLREQDWGSWTSKTVREIESHEPQVLGEQTRAGWKFCPPEGEDRLSVWRRSHNALCEAAANWSGQTILVVTHEGVIKSLIYRLNGRKFVPGEPPIIRSMHLHWLRHHRHGLQVEDLNALPLV